MADYSGKCERSGRNPVTSGRLFALIQYLYTGSGRGSRAFFMQSAKKTGWRGGGNWLVVGVRIALLLVRGHHSASRQLEKRAELVKVPY